MVRHWRHQLVERISGFIVLVTMLMFLARLAWRRQMALEVLNQRQIQLARTDSLTGCSNRRSFLETLEIEMLRAKRSAKTFSVLALDLDHFKTINDRYGHPGGDQALCQFVAIVGACIRPFDCLARMGGEEFAILLPETSVDAASAIAERTRMAVAAAVVQMPAEAAGMTVSIGVAQWRLDGPDTLEALLARADKALYEAKRAGRNQVRAMG
jgi:diguanylate cyclase (GGDEF)-like protein